jgi:lysophospholipase L1-like esterase
MKPRRRASRKRLGRAALALSVTAAAGLGLMATELILRNRAVYVVREQQSVMQSLGFIDQSPEYLIDNTPRGRRLIPGTSVIIKNHQTSGRDIPIRINSQGFRGPELTEKKPGQYRILALGDSITWGDALPEEETWVKLLEGLLSSARKSGPVEVVNGAVGDIGTREEVDILTERGLAVHPDLVLVGFYLNDSRPPWGFADELYHRGWLRRHSVLAETLYSRLALANWIHKVGEDRFAWLERQHRLPWKTDRDALRELAWSARYDWGAAWDQDSWATIDREFGRLEALARAHGFAVSIVIFPVSYQVYADYLDDAPQAEAKKLASRHGFRSFDLLPALRAHRTENLFFDQCHPRPDASALIAREIAGALKSQLSHDPKFSPSQATRP